MKVGRYQIHLALLHFVGYLSASRRPMIWSKGNREIGKGILGIPWGAGWAPGYQEMLRKGRTTCSLLECQIERALRICRKHPLACRSAPTQQQIQQAGDRRGAHLVDHSQRKRADTPKVQQKCCTHCHPVEYRLVLARPLTLMAWRTTLGNPWGFRKGPV